nr:uncharacterized protein LOC117281097 [Nicotiana tomentosiformis]
MAGRTTLAKSSLGSILSHVMQYIKLPAQVCSKIDRIQRNFIWGTTPIKRKMHFVGRRNVTRLNKEGGLNVHKNDFKNSAIHADLAWRMPETQQENNNRKQFTWVWNQKLPNKIKFFLWLVVHGRLPTSQHLHSRGINLNPFCFFCNKEEETICHIFLRCDNAKPFWEALSFCKIAVVYVYTKLLQPTTNENPSFIRSMLAALGHPPVKHVYREANRVADALAREGVKQQVAGNNCLVVPPVFVNEILWADILGTIFERKIRECNSTNVAIDYTLFLGDDNVTPQPFVTNLN